MKIQHIFLALLLLLMLSTCKKKTEEDLYRQKTKVHGRVLDYYTSMPAEGVKIVLVETEPKPYGHPYDYILTRKDSVYTDPVGYFAFSFRAKIGEKYRYYIFHPTEGDYFNGGEKDISKNSKNSISFSLKGRTSLQVHIKNINPFNYSDVLYWGTELLIGTNVDTIIVMDTDVYTEEWSLEWIVKKNDIQNNYKDTIDIAYRNIHYYEILY